MFPLSIRKIEENAWIKLSHTRSGMSKCQNRIIVIFLLLSFLCKLCLWNKKVSRCVRGSVRFHLLFWLAFQRIGIGQYEIVHRRSWALWTESCSWNLDYPRYGLSLKRWNNNATIFKIVNWNEMCRQREADSTLEHVSLVLWFVPSPNLFLWPTKVECRNRRLNRKMVKNRFICMNSYQVLTSILCESWSHNRIAGTEPN